MGSPIKYFSPGDVREAEEIQEDIRRRIRLAPLKREPLLVAAADAAYIEGRVFAAASLYAYPGLDHLADASFEGPVTFPYRSGFLAFREGPSVIGALRKLERPDVILVDGHGIAHPRGAGIACHVGVMLDTATIGCAKSYLTGDFDLPGALKGNWTYLYRDPGRRNRVGAVLRTRTNVNPLFISPGNLVDIGSCIRIISGCLSGYRIPEPLRRADMLSRRLARGITISGKTGR